MRMLTEFEDGPTCDGRGDNETMYKQTNRITQG